MDLLGWRAAISGRGIADASIDGRLFVESAVHGAMRMHIQWWNVGILNACR